MEWKGFRELGDWRYVGRCWMSVIFGWGRFVKGMEY